MDTRGALTIIAGLNIAAWIVALVLFDRLPSDIPIGWTVTGEVSAFKPKSHVFAIGPGLLALHAALAMGLPKIVKAPFDIESFKPTWLLLVILTQATIFILFLIIVFGSLAQEFPMDRAIFVCASLAFAASGNQLGKVRRNWFIGIRTPGTLGDDRTWDQTMRLAARLAVLAGITSAILATIAPLWTCSAVLVASVVVPVLRASWRR